MVHEYFHHIQDTIEDIDEVMHKVYRVVTAGEQRRTLYHRGSQAGKRGGKPSGWQTEAGRKDDFPGGYFGKTYANKWWDESPMEMLTMASESLLQGDKYTMRLWHRNTDFVDTFLGMMVDKRWKPSKSSVSIRFYTTKQ